MNKTDAIVASINHVLNLVDEQLDNIQLTPVKNPTHPSTATLSYKQLEFLAVSLYHQLTFLEEHYGFTFYTLNMEYLFEVKRDGVTKAFVYGTQTPTQNEQLEDTMCPFKPDTGMVTRYVPLIDEPNWKEFTDPTLILYAGLPIKFHYKTVYYSVASIIENLFGRPLTLIAGTKLDGFLKRAKNVHISKRILAL